MADASHRTSSSSSASTSPGARPAARRKVRKGTQSCWECKRRKIRCTFASPAHKVCDGCKSRQTRCVGQEYEDEPVTSVAERKADRLRRMESIVNGLVRQNQTRESVEENDCGESQCSPDRNGTVVKHAGPDQHHTSVSSVSLGLDAKTPADLSRHLLSLWPSASDVDRIVDAQVSTSFLLHGIVCQPYEGYFVRHAARLHRSVRRPPDGTHPVLVARSMLMLVTLLDGLPPGTPAGDVDPGELKERLYNAAARLVTANHELPPSLEGIESHLMEVMYLANVGNLRRAWLVNRRAVSLAQMMGLHMASSGSRFASSATVLDPSTRARVRPDYAWFRLVFTDRHLSLLLGLPQATTDNEAFAAPRVLEAHPPLERFERVMGVACSLILQRNAVSGNSDLDTTYEIDRTLQRAAALLTPQWWLVSPTLGPRRAPRIAGRDEAAFAETMRLMNQFIYHHLLVQLHLPYILVPASSTTDPRVDCSKITVANASRAILTRFIGFHASPASVSYCRAIDFFAFIASTTLCLVHIEAARRHRSQENGCFASGSGVSLLQPLLHQRHSDRAVMQSLLEIVGGMNQTGPDRIAGRIASILGPLLEIEADASRGGCYSVSAVEADIREGGGEAEKQGESAADFGDSSDAPRVLRIKIPFFGTIRIEHHPEWSGSGESPCLNGKDQEVGEISAQNGCTGDSSCSSVTNDTLPTHTTGRAIGSHALETGWTGASTMPEEQFSSLGPKSDDWTLNSASLYPEDVSEPSLFVPDLSSEEHWALQGVDIALFSNLTQGF